MVIWPPDEVQAAVPLCQYCRVRRPLPCPALLFERLSGSPKVFPPSVDRTKTISPPRLLSATTITLQAFGAASIPTKASVSRRQLVLLR
jgi:hypothetical protein